MICLYMCVDIVFLSQGTFYGCGKVWKTLHNQERTEESMDESLPREYFILTTSNMTSWLSLVLLTCTCTEQVKTHVPSSYTWHPCTCTEKHQKTHVLSPCKDGAKTRQAHLSRCHVRGDKGWPILRRRHEAPIWQQVQLLHIT